MFVHCSVSFMEATGATTGKQKATATTSDTPRQRFYIELDPDTTTFVSWKKLLKTQQQSSSKQETVTRVAPEAALKVDKKSNEPQGRAVESEQRNERILSSDRHLLVRMKCLSIFPEETDAEFLHKKRGKGLLKVYSRKSTALEEQIPTAKLNDTRRQAITDLRSKNVDLEGANGFPAARYQKDQGTSASDQPKLRLEKLTSHTIKKEYTPKGYLKKYNSKSELPDLNLSHHATELAVDKKARKKKISTSSSAAETNSNAQAHYLKQSQTAEHNKSDDQCTFEQIVSPAKGCRIDNLPNQSKMKRRTSSILKEHKQHQQAAKKKGKYH